MNWVDHTIWWHVYPLGFCGAPIRGEHTPAPRLRRLLNWLDYAVELGASGLLLDSMSALLVGRFVLGVGVAGVMTAAAIRHQFAGDPPRP